ncbi:uncharacterized protein PV09_03130 [Verruconis gallopava]|uniref:Uncharacterized protein n=1 Tax=Verruconis gallopava TaxID=253628 RepID=A0A0D2B3Z2_9PEZI|nr:uncharacterized protein PV09_03130 [Verruconis gallopava]KIW05939.1 hypothetical protein PV09_03130 [Verruconis gallopava]
MPLRLGERCSGPAHLSKMVPNNHCCALRLVALFCTNLLTGTLVGVFRTLLIPTALPAQRKRTAAKLNAIFALADPFRCESQTSLSLLLWLQSFHHLSLAECSAIRTTLRSWDVLLDLDISYPTP